MDKFRPRKETIHIQIGLDFGTSATKIVFAQVGGRFFRPILINHGLPNYPAFALPSVMAIDAEGHLLLGIDAAKYLLEKPWQEGFQRLKMVVAGKYDPSFREEQTEQAFHRHLESNKKDPQIYTPERLTSIFVAYAIRQAREAMAQVPEYQDYLLDLAFNICMPIDHLENNRVKPEFEKIFAWAEAIEGQWPRNGKNSDLLELSGLTENSVSYGHSDSRVFAIAEAVAETASYRYSLEKTHGLHTIIDFGAGTTDVSIFNLKDEFQELKPYWYSSRNIPWGMVHIERLLAQQMVSYMGVGRILTCHNLSDLITSLNQETSSAEQALMEAMQYLVKEKFEELANSHDYKQAWRDAYGKLSSPAAWENVKILVGGGGSQAPFIDQVFSFPWYTPEVSATIPKRYPVNQLPEPGNYDSLNGTAPFHRMAVAYGLAIPAPLLGEYIPPRDCPNHTPCPLPVRDIVDYDLQ